MWFESLPQGRSWTSLISDHVLCECNGIRTVGLACPACGSAPYNLSPQIIEDSTGVRLEIPPAFRGAEGGIEDYQLLALMEREWHRPSLEPALGAWLTKGMSDRATLVLLYWTYFETRMIRLVDLGLRRLPPGVRDDLSARYDSVSSHMKQLYQILFGVRYLEDLIAVGAEPVGGHLARVQDARNRFVHGDPGAISDQLVEAVVKNMKLEHDAWTAVFNRRIIVMSLSLVHSRALIGLQAATVTVEVHLANGLPSFTLVGLAETEVKEARERVRSAIQNAGLEFPNNDLF